MSGTGDDRDGGGPDWAAPESDPHGPPPVPAAPPSPDPAWPQQPGAAWPPPPGAAWPASPDPAWQPPPGGPVGWAQPLRDISGLAKGVIIFSVLLALVDVLSALTSFAADDAYEQAAAEGRAAADVFTVYDLVNILYVVLIPTWVLGSLWLSRARSNAAQLAPSEVRRSPAWAWLGWVVPVVSLWFPKQIVDDSWRVATRANRDGSGDPHSPLSMPSTAGWWALWLLYLFLSNAVGRVAWQADDMTELVVPGLETAVAVVGVAALAAWIRVVRGVTREHQRLAGFSG